MAAADERINRALSDAVERLPTNDPGMRSILKRAIVVCHPESEHQKNIALDTEQDSTPYPSLTYRGSSASGTQPSITTSTDQNTGTGDVTHFRRDSNKQQESQRWRHREEERQCRRQQCRTPEVVGVRQHKEDHNEEGTT